MYIVKLGNPQSFPLLLVPFNAEIKDFSSAGVSAFESETA